MTIRLVTHKRLGNVIVRWRRQQRQLEELAALDPTGERRRLADVYRQCANDLDLALRDDVP